MRRRLFVPILIVRALFAAGNLADPALSDDSKVLSPAEVARIGRPSSALVVVTGSTQGEGSAFCVRSDGLFVTNHHVIEPAKDWAFDPATRAYKVISDGKISLVFNSGQDNQKIVTARVVRSDRSWDLALLQAEGVEGFPALAIASQAELAATRDVVALGFPLGSALAVKDGLYPSANANKGKVRTIKKDAYAPSDIEADLSINPGNSGGPLLDDRGRVAGVIYARMEPRGKPGYSLAVPVNRLEWFLSRPEIAFEPPNVARDGAEKPVEFKATLTSEFAPKEPVTMELVLGAWGKGARHYPMTLLDGTYRVEAPLFAGTNPARGVRVAIGTTSRVQPLGVAWVEDYKLSGEIERTQYVKESSGSTRLVREKKVEEFPLASTRKLAFFPRNISATVDGNPPVDYSKVAGADAVLTAFKDQQPTFGRAENFELTVDEVSDEKTVIGTVVARRSGRLVARVSVPMTAEAVERPSLKAVSEGRFIQPHFSRSRVNSIRVFIPEGDPAARVESTRSNSPTKGPNSQAAKVDDRTNAVAPGPDDPSAPGGVYQYGDTFSMVTTQFNRTPFHGNRGGLKISFLGPVRTSILLLLADSDSLKIGEFAIQAPESFNPSMSVPAASHLQVASLLTHGHPEEAYSGRFRVWEFEMARGAIMRLAVDFVLERKPEQPGGKPRPSIVGMVRANSKYQ